MVTIEEILNDMSPSQREIVKKVRSLIQAIVPDAVEKVRQEKIIAYAVKNKDFVRINTFRDHIDVDFMCGAHLISGDLRDRGTGGTVKHVKIANNKSVEEDELKNLIEEAAQTVC